MDIEYVKNPIISGIVTYNPDLNRLRQNINAIIKQVDRLIIVDNCSNNINELSEITGDYECVDLICNKGNYGIAKALNQIMDYSSRKEANWVLTLDQDSVVSKSLIQHYLKYVQLPGIGMMTCRIKDRNADWCAAGSIEKDYKEVERCITSGCFTNVDAWKKVGGFDEKMFIDYVDYDICLSLREAGYKIIQVNYEGLLHELGHSKDVRFLGRNWVVSNHSSFRKYYIVRNRIYYIKKHSKSLNTILEWRHLLGFIVLTLFREPNKVNNFKAMYNGLIDSKKM